MLRIVFLDAYSVGDADTSPIAGLGTWQAYETTSPAQVLDRCREADVVITNKVKLMRPELEALPHLKLICIAATGMNNVDLQAAEELGIAVRNVAGYSTDSVAQHTFALLLGLLHQTRFYDDYVKTGIYSESGRFTHQERAFFEIGGKTWGIVGMGNIGQKVAGLATAFGAKVVYHSTSGKNLEAGYPQLGLNDLLEQSNVLSIHAPLNAQTLGLIGYEQLCRMKSGSILLNLGRGGIVDEAALALALREGRLAGAGIDVFDQEPLPSGNPLLADDLAGKVLFSPHIAWASREARQRLLHTIARHIRQHFGLTD